LRISQ